MPSGTKAMQLYTLTLMMPLDIKANTLANEMSSTSIWMHNLSIILRMHPHTKGQLSLMAIKDMTVCMYMVTINQVHENQRVLV